MRPTYNDKFTFKEIFNYNVSIFFNLINDHSYSINKT